jgi:hypothetical protein
MPAAIVRMPRDQRGYPIPFFLQDAADFRVVCYAKKKLCHEKRLCWVCGEKLDKLLYFVGGRLSVMNHLFGDYAMHETCAEYSIRVCPMLNGTMASYRHSGLPEEAKKTGPGMVLVQPEIVAMYATKHYQVWKKIYKVGKAVDVRWFRNGERIDGPGSMDRKKIMAEYEAKRKTGA